MMFAHDLSNAKLTQTTLNEITASTTAKNRAATSSEHRPESKVKQTTLMPLNYSRTYEV